MEAPKGGLLELNFTQGMVSIVVEVELRRSFLVGGLTELELVVSNR